MTKKTERYKEEICRLHREFKLKDVMNMMKDQGFEASESWYRKRFSEWEERKGDHLPGDSPGSSVTQPTPFPTDPPTKALPQRPPRHRPLTQASFGSYDSGYASATDPFRSSVSTTASSPLAGKPLALDNHDTARWKSSLASIIQTFPQPPPFAYDVGLDSNIPTQHISDVQDSVPDWPKRSTSLNYGQVIAPTNLHSTALLPASQERSVQTALYPYSALEPSTSIHGSASSHPPNSRCRLAGNQFFVPTLELGPCPGCEASKAHFVASVARLMPPDALIDQVEQVKSYMKKTDIFGNTPLHHLASTAPTAKQQIDIFVGARVKMYRTNLENENFLHVLDASNLGNDLLLLLEEVYNRDPALLRARTYHGKTVLHCLLSRPIRVSLLSSVLHLFKSVESNINARDNQGLTAMEIFCKHWLLTRDHHQRSKGEWDQLQSVIGMHVPNLKLLPMTTFILPPGSNSFNLDKILDGKSPNGRHSQDHSIEALELRHREMKAIMTESVHNPVASDYQGRNGLHCFAHTLPPSSDLDMSWGFHPFRQELMDMLNCGVDAIDYDRNGQTPLHTFLSTCYNSGDEKMRAVLINSMLGRAPGVRDVHMRDGKGETPLYLACKSGLVTCVEMLLIHNSDVFALNYEGRSVIYEANQARIKKMRSNPEEAARIQQCINLVEKKGGRESVCPLEDVVYLNNARKL